MCVCVCVCARARALECVCKQDLALNNLQDLICIKSNQSITFPCCKPEKLLFKAQHLFILLLFFLTRHASTNKF